jgi:L-amino acid N-acyltransferase YncA
MNTIRLARPSDAISILDIYAPYILNTSFTFETEVPPNEAFAKRIISYLEDWPWLVCEIDGVLAGYAYATRHRERAAYQWCVESSVYVRDNFQQKGVAGTLYNALFEILKYQGCRNVYAGITLPNDKSVAFHKKFGFTWIADYKDVGYKLGKWNTVSWWQLQLNDYSENPVAPMKFPLIDHSFLKNVFTERSKMIKGV